MWPDVYFIECEEGYFGITCSSRCGHCANGETCDKHSGRCYGGCVPQFLTPYCQGIIQYMAINFQNKVLNIFFLQMI